MTRAAPDSGNSWFGPVEKSGAWESDAGGESFGRLWRAFMAARVTLASVLLALQASIYALGQPVGKAMIALCVTYFVAALAVRVWARPKPPGSTFDAQWLSTVGVDVLAFSALNFLQSGSINYTALFALPVLLAAALAAAKVLLTRGSPGRAFFASFSAIVFFCLTGFAGIYPALLPSRLDPVFSLTVYDSASSPYTLKLMTLAALVFLPVAAGCQIWVYRLFNTPLAAEELKKSGMY